MSREKWGSSQSWGTHIVVIDAGRPSGQPGEKWGGYVAASRSPSRGADGVAARAATPSGGVDRDNSYDAISSEQESAQFEFCR